MSTLSPPNYREPFTDANGYVSRYWRQFLEDLFTRVGGTTSRTITEINIDMPEDSGVAELAASIFSAEDSFAQVPFQQNMVAEEFLLTQVRELSEQVALLTKQLEEVKQGTML